jgi:hypothetical protein
MKTTEWTRLDAEGSHGLFVHSDGHWRAAIVEPDRVSLPPGVHLDDLPPVPEPEPDPADVVMALRAIGPELTLGPVVQIPGGWRVDLWDSSYTEAWSHQSPTLDGALVGAHNRWRISEMERDLGRRARCVPVHTEEDA